MLNTELWLLWSAGAGNCKVIYIFQFGVCLVTELLCLYFKSLSGGVVSFTDLNAVSKFVHQHSALLCSHPTATHRNTPRHATPRNAFPSLIVLQHRVMFTTCSVSVCLAVEYRINNPPNISV
jgi:hypothetical protein